jgi:hypothetical protein
MSEDIIGEIPVDIRDILTVEYFGEPRLNELGLADFRTKNAEKNPSYDTWEFAEKALRHARQHCNNEKKVDYYRKLCYRVAVVRDSLDKP